jgi:hypothetical protein
MMRKKNVVRIAIVTAIILLVPLVAMQFTDEVVWDLTDFVVAGALLFGAGLTYELVASKGATTAYRVAVGIAVATGLMLVWMNLAVGLIGSEDNPANLLYGAVLAVGIIGAIIARLRPHGMVRALFATALTQALVPVIALIIWKPQVNSAEDFWGMVGVFGANTFFAILFIGSAGLFRRAAREHPQRTT